MEGQNDCRHGEVCEAGETKYSRSNCLNPTAEAAVGSSLYRHGGTAQAYKPNQPEKSVVCGGDYGSSPHRVASSSYYRSTRKTPPKIVLNVHLWNCGNFEDSCCRQLIKADSGTMVEVWQARPTGTYSSIRPGQEDGDCRAVQIVNETNLRQGKMSFDTYAPGSTGSLGGLGPSGWDTPPYGMPVIHAYISGPNHQSTLINVPLLMAKNTLKRSNFSGRDWRGAAWTQHVQASKPFSVSSWVEDTNKNTIEIVVDVQLYAKQGKSSNREALCQSRVYGLPSSFFVEPIAVCGKSLTDFFAL